MSTLLRSNSVQSRLLWNLGTWDRRQSLYARHERAIQLDLILRRRIAVHIDLRQREGGDEHRLCGNHTFVQPREFTFSPRRVRSRFEVRRFRQLARGAELLVNLKLQLLHFSLPAVEVVVTIRHR